MVNTCFEKVRNSKKREFDTFIALKSTLQFPVLVRGCFSFSGLDGSFCWHRDQCLYPADIGVVVGAVAAGEVMDELINESEFGYLDG